MTISVEAETEDSRSGFKSETTEFLPGNSDSRNNGGRKARKRWRPIRLSRLPSLRSSTRRLDFSFDQCPNHFSGYTASSEDDSSSTDMSDASPNYSEFIDERDETNQVPVRTLMRRSSLRRMKSITRIPSMKLRRPLMRKLSREADPKRKFRKSRSIKISTSESARLFRRYANSRDDQGSAGILTKDMESQPHYLKPTSSSDLKKVRTQPSNRKLNTASTGKRSLGGLTRTASLRPSRTLTKVASMRSKRSSTKKISPIQDSGMLRATRSSALRDSKFRDQAGEIKESETASSMKVCPYSYCSLHGHHHANVPPLKRFVCIRRRLLKPQKSMKLGNRPSIILKRSSSKKKRTQKESARDNISISSIAGTVGNDLEDLNNVLVRESSYCEELERPKEHETLPLTYDETISGLEFENLRNYAESNSKQPEVNNTTFAANKIPVVTARKQWENPNPFREEKKEDSEPEYTFSQGFPLRRDSKPRYISDTECRTGTEKPKNVKFWRLVYQHMVTDLDGEAETSQAKNTEENSNAVKLVRKAFEEILSEIPDYSSDNKSIAGDKASNHEHVEEKTCCDSATRSVARDADEVKHGAENSIVSEEKESGSKAGNQPNQKIPKNWSYLKKVILLNRFVKALEQVRNSSPRKPRYLSAEPEKEAEKIRLRHQLAEERKNAEEWKLDYALRQVITTLAPSQKRKVALLVQAFETVIPSDSVGIHLEARITEFSHGTLVQACTTSPIQNAVETLSLGTDLRENNDKATESCEAKQPILISLPEVEHLKENDNPSSFQDQTISSCKDISVDEKASDEVNGDRILNLGFESYDRNSESNVIDLVASAATKITSETSNGFSGVTSDESAGSIANGNSTASVMGVLREESDSSVKEKTEQSEADKSFQELSSSRGRDVTNGTKMEKQNLIRWRNLIYKHMITGLKAEDEIKQEVSKEECMKVSDLLHGINKSGIGQGFSGTERSTVMGEDGNVADSQRDAVKLVQQAFEKILSEIPDRSSNEEAISPSSSSVTNNVIEDKTDLQREVKRSPEKISVEKERKFKESTPKNWNNLKKVILLKRFVKDLEKVRNFNPRKPRYLALEPDPEAEKIHLRHQSAGDMKRSDEWMLDYVLRQVISTLAPSQRRKVALLVQAFDTVIVSGQVLPLQDGGTCLDSGTPVLSQGTHGQNDGETGKEDKSPHFLEKTPSSEITLEENQNKVCEFSIEEQHIQPVNLYSPAPGEDTLGDKSYAECSSAPACTGDVTYKIKTGKQKNIKLWNLIYQHMVTGLGPQNVYETRVLHGMNTSDNHQGFSEVEPGATVEKEYHDAVTQKIETGSDNAVKLVQQALDKILSEIPDQSSDAKSIAYDITADREHNENSSADVVEGCIFSSSNPAIDTVVENPDGKAGEVIICEQKLESKLGNESNQKSPNSWSTLKKVILLKRFVKALETFTNFSPRNPQDLSPEPDAETEKIRLRSQSTEGRKNVEEWMLDYALQQVISTLAPSQGKKVAFLAQAFDSVGIKDIANCSSPSTTASSPLPLEFSTFSPVQSGHETEAESTFGILLDRKICDSASQTSHGDLTEDDIAVVTVNEIDNSHLKDCMSHKKIPRKREFTAECMNKENTDFVSEANGDTSSNNLKKLESRNLINDVGLKSNESRTPQKDSDEESKSACRSLRGSPTLEESEHTRTSNVDINLEKQTYTSLWRLLCKHMVSGTPTQARNQPQPERASKQGENNDDGLLGRNISTSHFVSGKENYINMENYVSDGANTKPYQMEAVKLLEEAIDEISLPESRDDSRDDQSISSDIIPDQELLGYEHAKEDRLVDSANIKNHEDTKTTLETETESMPQMRKNWKHLKNLILLKRFVKALEKARKLNPREPRYLPLNPDAEEEKVHLRHEEMRDRKHGEEWMLDYALQEVVAKLTPARKRKVQLLVQAFETVIPATGN